MRISLENTTIELAPLTLSDMQYQDDSEMDNDYTPFEFCPHNYEGANDWLQAAFQ
jgi:hypothetical protein